MSEFFHTSGSTRAYPNKPIAFAEFEQFAPRMDKVIIEPFRESWDEQRDIAIIDQQTGDVELIAVQLGSDHVGFYVRSSPSRRVQRMICDRFGVEIVLNRMDHRLEFILAETASLMPLKHSHAARPTA